MRPPLKVPAAESGSTAAISLKIVHAVRLLFVRGAIISGLALVVALPSSHAQAPALAPAEKHRIVLLTDIGGDVDDMQSLTRFLMYADQYDIEGLIATSIRIFPKDAHRPLDGDAQPHYIVEWIKAYAQVRDNLLKHSAGWPEPEALLAMVRKGAKTGRDGPFNIRTGIAEPGSGHFPLEQILGADKDTEASQLLIEVVDRDDPRPVWVCIWGGSLELAQALWRVRHDRSPADLAAFVDKLRVYAWGHQDATGLWILQNFPELRYIESTGGIVYSAEPKLHDQAWLDSNVRFGHGPLGALCPLRKGVLGEADSETFLGLIPNGLSMMEHPEWGGWGGRFQLKPGSKTQWIDLPSNLNPTTLGSTISRWALHFQNDYEARMDWCVKPYAEANHPPVVQLEHALHLTGARGETVRLSARGSHDPDGDALTYCWWQFTEVDTYAGTIEIRDASAVSATFRVPDDASPGDTIHVICEVTDSGAPRLTRYQRVVVTVR